MLARPTLTKLFVLALVAARAAAAHAADAPLTLEAALDLALANNERSLKTPERVEVAAGGVDRARSAFLPTLVGGGTGIWAKPADRDGRNLSGSVAFSLNQPLVNAPAIPLWRQAKYNYESERWGAIEDLRVLMFDTTNAFLTVLTGEKLLAAANARVARAKADRDDSAARAQAGLTSTNDVTRADLAVATAQGQVATAQGNLERAQIALGYIVGKPLNGPLVEPETTSHEAHKGQWKREDVVQRAETRRPDVQSAADHTLSLREGAIEPLYRLIPTLGLSGSLRQLIDPGPSAGAATSGNIQLVLTWTIFDAGARYADRRTRVAQAESAYLDEHALRRSVASDIASALAALHAARSVYDISLEAVVTAQKNTDETSILYKQGLAKAIEVTDANASQYDAESTLAEAKLAMEQAYLNLRYSLGLGPVTDDLPRLQSVKRGKH
jgi:outer membrane protein TolC